MNDEATIREAARERLFDAALAEAVQAGLQAAQAGLQTRAASAQSRRTLYAALMLLGLGVVIAIAVLQARSRDEAQDPNAFDPLFPRVENEWLWGEDPVQFGPRSGRLDALPERGPAGALVYDARGIEVLARQPGVRQLCVAGEQSIGGEGWRQICRMADLEYLTIMVPVTAADLRELRRAPRLQALMFCASEFEFDEAMAAAMSELPRLSCVMFAWPFRAKVQPDAIGRLRGLPLQALYFEAKTIEPGWLAELSRIRTLRWLFLHSDVQPAARLGSDDLHHLAELPKLSCLSLSNIAIAEADLHLLPASIEVLDLRYAEQVTAAGVRALVERPRLRGLGLGKLAPDAEQVLSELLPRTQLERFAFRGGLSASLWGSIEQVPTLRRLQFETRRTNADELAHCARLPALEQIDVVVSGFPGPYDLGALRSLQRLRRVTITDGSGHGGPSAADREAMRASLPAQVELVVRR